LTNNVKHLQYNIGDRNGQSIRYIKI
jgi:hypothetical protein